MSDLRRFFTYLIIIIYKYFKQATPLNKIFDKLKDKKADDAAEERAEIAGFFNSLKNPFSGAWRAFDTNLLVHTVYDESGQSKKQLRNPLSAVDCFQQRYAEPYFGEKPTVFCRSRHLNRSRCIGNLHRTVNGFS